MLVSPGLLVNRVNECCVLQRLVVVLFAGDKNQG